jgi:hypothetical protein
MRIEALALIGAVGFAGCSPEREQIANEAPNKMIGFSTEQVLTCMGARRFPPPWTIDETDASYIVRDRDRQALAYVSISTTRLRKMVACRWQSC